ncbi:urease accessory protein UreF [Priestia megaterium]|jgi:urease accessory protein|uniref:Urease accessory protein UreF n=1 Tax=Priestia megaterium TaxID=1404 RepID=A0A6H1NZF3_PRIMG|nr:urease accessory protein UreF [Priestia megaterium]QIZ06700.1 urease accessory protein UreF [Priestia megaterium]
MDNQLLSLLQIGDSNFPSGAFSHSFGLETYIQDEAVYSKETFFEWIRIYLEKQIAYTDGLACRLTFDALQKNDKPELWVLDQKLFVQNIPKEAREANRRIGERLIRMGIDLYSIPLLEEYLKKIRAKEAYGHPGIAFSIICQYLGIEKRKGILTFLYSSMVTLIQNGVRGIPLGQTAGQRILLELHPYLQKTTEIIEGMDADDFGAVAPGIEISQMRHERLHTRLFMS